VQLVDCHTHTTFSDGADPLARNVDRALELGLTCLCCTDHLTLPRAMDPACEVSVAEGGLAALAADVARERERARAGGCDLVFGFECDYYAGCEPNVARWAAGATFLLGSVHALDGRWIDDLSDLSYWDETGTEATWRRYFEVWAEACASPCGFDSMAHPDLVMLLGRFPDDALRDRLYDGAAEAARAAGVRVELNTAGLLKPVGRMYPHPGLLRRFRAAGVPLTVGSDAHVASRVGQGVAEAYALAWEAGYRRVEVPCADGGWRHVDL
jgi:histidinol-phosphatase (PHP family)